MITGRPLLWRELLGGLLNRSRSRIPPEIHSTLERAATELWVVAQQHADAHHTEAGRVMHARLAEVEGDLRQVEGGLDRTRQAQAQRDAAAHGPRS